MSAENININLSEDSNYSNDDLESILEDLDNYQEYNDMLSDLDDEGITINIISSDEEGSGIQAGRDENDPTQWNITIDKEYGRAYKNQYLGDDGKYHDMSDERALLHEIFHAVQIEVLDFPYPSGPSIPFSYIEALENEAVKHTNDIMEGHGEERRVEDYFNPKNHKQVPLTDIPVPSINPEDTPQWMQDLLDDLSVAENTPAPISPLVLDLDGQGIDLASVLGTDAVYWDIDIDGFAEKSGWISGNDGLLAIDLNSDGIINDHGELFGTETVDGFTVLSAYDSNSDNVIDVNDAQFADLLVWVDANSDGYSQSGELFSLTDLNITSINLNASLVNYDLAGNHVTHESTFTINGQTQTIVDAWFAYDNTNSRYTGDYTLDLRVMFLPTLRGFGDVKDLHIAMSMDETLLLMVQEIANSGDALLFDSAFDLNGKMEAVLYRWAGVDGVDPTSRGVYVDARQLEFLEKYLGDSFDHFGGNTPTVGAGGLATDIFISALSTLSSHLLIQTSASSFFGEDAYYDFALGKIENSSLDGIYFLTPNQIMNQTTDTSNAYVISDINSSYEISENNGGGYDEIWIQGVQESELRLVRVGLNLEISIGSETITVVNQFKSDNNLDSSFDYFRVENIVLDDGTKIDLINDLTFTGTSGNDVLIGLHADDTLIGAEGDDDLRGGYGNDTYIWSVGDGNDTIREYTGSDTLILHGVQESELRLEHISNGSLIIHIGNELITIENQFWANTHTTSPNNTRYEVETIILDDGTVLDLTQGITFTGTENDDVVRSSLGNDVLVGNAGNDILLGDNGDDTLIGGTGDDELRGGYENNTFIWSIGDGNDTIQEAGGSDTLILHGVQQSGVSFVQSGNNLSINIGSETITVENHFLTHNDYKVENVAFDDGSVINLQVLLNVAPTAQDDAFIGDQDLSLSGNVLVNNGSGLDNDPDGNTLGVVAGTYASLHGSVVVSANGDFTYTPTAGYNGVDSFIYTLDDGFGGSDTATVNITVRPPNVAPIAQDDAFTGDEDISITGNVLSDNGNGVDTDPDSDPMTVIAGTYSTTNGSVVISSNGSFTYTPNTGYVGADSFTYTLQDDRGGSGIGTANITVNALANNPNAINGTSANDMLNGDPNGMSNDTLIGYGGADILNGKLGNDSYVWSVGDGNDIINETGGVDQLVLHGVVASDINLEYTSDGSLKVHIGSEEITVVYHFYSDKYSSSYYDTYQVESILLDDGLTIDLLNNITLTGTASGETINGLNAATTFVGEAGNDILNGKLGNDSYVWSVGDGNDTINETGGVDELVLHGVIASDLRFENMLDGSLKVHIGNEEITVVYHFYSDKYSSSYYDTYQVESILLDDGSTIDLLNNLTFTGTASGETIIGTNGDDVLYGLAGSDIINASGGADTLIGGSGVDTLNGKLGNDSYVWSVGDGNDIINETGGVDQLVLHGVIASDIGFEYMFDGSLKVHIGSEEITVVYHFYSDKYNSSYYDTYQVESILLDDGSTIDLLNNLTFTGTAGGETIIGTNGDDVLYGLAGSDIINASGGADTLIGGSGVDTLNGKLGNDSYVWSVGDGNDIINETGGVDQLVLHGVIASDIGFEYMSDGSLKVHIGSEEITVVYHFYSDKYSSSYYDTYQVESILLDDGSTIDLLNNITLTGTASGETINGLNAATTFVGEAGNDILNGKLGNDSYVWSVGDGNDIINETGGVDQLVLHGVIASDLRFENMLDGSLKVYIGNEEITVVYHFYSDKYSSSYYDTYQVESILLDDGSTIDLLNNLTFTGTASGETINGLNANDILFGLDGADTLNGNNGNDILHGGNGSDYLYGNAGDDVLYGGAGVDMLYGQAGADTFVFESSTAFTASDNIQDFNLSDGDKLDISDLLIGYDPLTDAISDFVQITESGSNSYLSVDADGGADNFVQVAYIYNETGLTDENALEISGNLITA